MEKAQLTSISKPITKYGWYKRALTRGAVGRGICDLTSILGIPMVK